MVIHRGWDQETGERRQPITLEEWLAAIVGVDGIRLCTDNPHVVNPQTGERIEWANHGGDVEFYSKPAKQWARAFQWSPRGHINVNYVAFMNRKGFYDIAIPQELARRLGARIWGEGRVVIEGDLVE